jgi:ribonuclease HII
MPDLLPFYGQLQPEAGCDEAGRGCLAGPVVAAAVVLTPGTVIPGLDDSKKLSHKQRFILRDIIMEKAVSWAVEFIDNNVIDEINILNATFLAMHNALNALCSAPVFILVDGNRFRPYMKIPHLCVIKGDGKYLSIAAASVLAKTARDEYMENIHMEFPLYNWKQNKGYPTIEHKLAIHEHGFTPYHRRTFSSSIQMKMF